VTLDAAAIERLYRSHGYIVLRRARALLGSEPDAQEALQEVFASLLRSPQVLRSAGSAVGWLYQATTHFCLNQLRNLLSRMPADVAAAAVYHYLDGMTHAEVAELLGCSRRQVGYLLERARQSLEHMEQSA